MGPRPAGRRRGPRGRRAACWPRPTSARRRSPSATPGSVAELDGPGLAAAMAELGAIAELVGRAGNYAHLRFAADTTDPANGALVARVSERGDRDRDEAALLRPRVGGARRRARRASCSPPTASTRAATTCARSAATGRTCSPSPRRRSWPRRRSPAASAWSRLFERADERDPGRAARRRTEPVNARRRARAGCCAPDREVRRTTAEAVTAALAPGLRTRAYIFNTLLAGQGDRRPPARLPDLDLAAATSPTRPATSRSQALVEAVRARYDIPQRWYRLKARLLGLDRLADYDRAASVATDEDEIRVARGARDRARRRFSDFSPSWPTRPSASSTSTGSTRRCGPASAAARSAPTPCPSVHPYVMLNWTVAPPRRADARPRARPRHPRRARRSRRGSSSSTRRSRSPRRRRCSARRSSSAACSTRPRRRPRGSRCWPRTSRARSRPSSARSR